MKLGAEPKKLATFIGLIAVAAIVYWMNSSSDAPAPSVARAPVDPAAAVVAPVASTRTANRRSAVGVDSVGDFIFKLPDHVDPTKVDPTLRLDVLAKLQAVQPEGGVRFIFQIGQPPPDPVVEAAKGNIPKVDPLHPNDPPGSTKPPASTEVKAPAPPPGPPPTPPISLKYYGYSTKRSDGEKKAFFLDGEDIIVAAEGEIIEKRYKVVRISPTKVEMEDTASKSTQTLPLQPEAAPV